MVDGTKPIDNFDINTEAIANAVRKVINDKILAASTRTRLLEPVPMVGWYGIDKEGHVKKIETKTPQILPSGPKVELRGSEIKYREPFLRELVRRNALGSSNGGT